MKETAEANSGGMQTTALAAGLAVVAVVTGSVVAKSPDQFVLAAAACVVVLLVAAKAPELFFVLFLTAGFYKNDPRFQLPGIDPTILFGALTVLGIVWRAFQKEVVLYLPPKKAALPYLAIIWLAGLSLMYTTAPVYGADKLTRLATITAFSLFAPLYLFRGGKRMGVFFGGLVIVAFVMLNDIISQGINVDTKVDISAFGSDYLALGYIQGIGLILSLVYFAQAGKSLAFRSLFIAFTPIIVYGLLISGARGPLLSSAATLVIVVFLASRPHKESRRLSAWVWTAFIAATAYLTINLHEFIRMSERLNILGDGGGQSALERVSMMQASLDALSSLPVLLTGLGIGGFTTFYRGFDDIRGAYPHNIFLEAGTELGVAGFVALTAFTFWGFAAARKAVKTGRGDAYFLSAAVIGLLVYTLLNALKSGDINDNRMFFTSVGLAHALVVGDVNDKL
ncbi:MAG TPA: O-antigen ligase family protein [Nitrospirota bacterium]